MSPARQDPSVTKMLKELDHPLIDVITAIREQFLAEPRLEETVKWKSPTYMYKGNLASVDPKSKQHVLVLFHQGAKIPGRHPLLQGEGTTARYARFKDERSVRAGRAGLRAIIKAWCDWRDAEGPPARSG